MDLRQGSPAWFSARKDKLTASNFGAAAGINPYVSRKKALRQKLGLEESKVGNLEACRWGTRNERNAIKDYMIRTGNCVRSKGLFTHPHYSWLAGSPDGLVGTEGIVEVKCPFAQMVPHAKIPPHYLCQINGLLEIMDKQWCDYITWTPSEFKVYRVYRDPDLFQYLLDRYTMFYACMKRGAEMPRMLKGEKDEVLQRIAESDEYTDYGFWSYLEPASLNGRWDSPPAPDATDDESSEQSSNELGGDEVRCDSDEVRPLPECPEPRAESL